MLSAVIRWESSYPAMQTVSTTGTPGIPSSQSSRTRDKFPQISTIMQDRDRTVLRRSEPSSRTALMGEQPNPWELLHPQDAMSRHRGAKPHRRCGRLDAISLFMKCISTSYQQFLAALTISSP